MLPPLSFRPLFKNYLWGGRRLESMLGKPLGDGPHWAESWELVDHGDDQSVVADGPLAEMTLRELVAQFPQELFGQHAPQFQFPLLLKYLDAQRTLSVQVHPDDEQGAKLEPPDLGKTEAWVVLAAEPGSKIYAGLKPGVDRVQLAAAIDAGRCDECLHSFEPAVGDCVFIEAGTVHALGEGLVIAEIQQASNTTFRLLDWNRVDTDGQPRPLHIEQSLATINFARGPVDRQVPQTTGDDYRERLVQCDKFVLDRFKLRSPIKLPIDNRFHILTLCSGAGVALHSSAGSVDLTLGQTVLLPACSQDVSITPRGDATLLDMYLP